MRYGDVFSYLVTLRVERVLKSDDIWVLELLHDLQLSVLIPFVLVHFLDGDDFASFSTGSLKICEKKMLAENVSKIQSEFADRKSKSLRSFSWNTAAV